MATPAWDPTKSYLPGDRVADGGREWLAAVANKASKPGSRPGIWVIAPPIPAPTPQLVIPKRRTIAAFDGNGGFRVPDDSEFPASKFDGTFDDIVDLWASGPRDSTHVLATDGTIVALGGGGGAVDSVNGQTGVVVLTAGDIAGFAAVATSGAYSDLSGLPVLFDGAYSSLTGIPSTFAPSGHHTSHEHGGSDVVHVSVADITGLAAVATSGAYSDLSGTPSGLPPTGSAGGDLTGSYPNPTLASASAVIAHWAGTPGGLFLRDDGNLAAVSSVPATIANLRGDGSGNAAPWARQDIADAVASISTELTVYTSLTTNREADLPNAGAWSNSSPLWVVDGSGSASATKKIQITPQAAQTINGSSSSFDITSPFEAVMLWSDGSSNWIAVRIYASALSAVALSGAYSDLSGTPTIPTITGSSVLKGSSGNAVAATATNVVSLFTGSPTGAKFLRDDGTIAQVAYSQVTGTPSLAAVATSGAYSDLTGTPTIPTISGSSILKGNSGNASAAAYSDLKALIGNITKNLVLAGPTTGSAAQPDFRTLIAEDLASGTATAGLALLSSGVGAQGVWSSLTGSGIGILRDKDRNRPAANSTKNFFFATDTGQQYWTDQTEWHNFRAGADKVTTGSLAGAFTDAIFWQSAAGATSGPIWGNSRTIAIAFQMLSSPGTAGGILISMNTSGGFANGWLFGGSTVNSGKLRFVMSGVNSSGSIEINATPVLGFNVLVANYTTGGNIRFTLNGGAVGTAAVSGTYTVPISTTQLTVGRYTGGGGFFCGWADFGWLYEWPSLLSDADMQAVGSALTTFLPGVISTDPSYMWQSSWMNNDSAAAGSPGYAAYGSNVSKSCNLSAQGVGIYKTNR